MINFAALFKQIKNVIEKDLGAELNPNYTLAIISSQKMRTGQSPSHQSVEFVQILTHLVQSCWKNSP